MAAAFAVQRASAMLQLPRIATLIHSIFQAFRSALVRPSSIPLGRQAVPNAVMGFGRLLPRKLGRPLAAGVAALPQASRLVDDLSHYIGPGPPITGVDEPGYPATHFMERGNV